MFSSLSTVILIVSLLVGGSGATVAAAQGAQPDGLLYPVKGWTEEVRYTLAGDDAARLELSLKYASRRMAEILTQLEKGRIPPEMVQIRLQEELETALNLAAGLPEDESLAALQRIQVLLQNQLQNAFGWQVAEPAGEQVMEQVRAMLQEQLWLCDEGLQDPQTLREQLQQRQSPARQPGSTQIPGADATSGSIGGQNPWTTGTPAPDSSYGPGPGENQNPWTAETPTPGSGYGPGPGGDPNPWTNLTPTPGSGYGPGPGDGTCETCTPNAGQPAAGTPEAGGNRP